MKLTNAAVFLLSTVTTASAQNYFFSGRGTPDGLTAGANGFTSICDGFEGKAKAQCSNYCYAMDCYLNEGATVPAEVCDGVLERFVEATEGELPPCINPCPCFDAEDLTENEENFCLEYDDGPLLVTNKVLDLNDPETFNAEVKLASFSSTGTSGLCFKGKAAVVPFTQFVFSFVSI